MNKTNLNGLIKSNDSSLETETDKELVEFWKGLKHKPTVIVFDLDYTLWPSYIDNFSEFISKKLDKNNEIVLTDSYGQYFKAFSNVTLILKTLKEKCLFRNQYLAIASRAHSRDIALQAIEYFGWKKYFNSIQIYSNTKVNHMNAIRQELKLKKFNQMLFFDDEEKNINETTEIGVFAYLVTKSHGFNKQELLNGLSYFNNKEINNT